MALRIGVIGAGAIAPPYYMAMQAWPQLELASCTSRGMASARAAAAKYGIAAVSLEAMLADPAIDVVVNLTPIQAHHSIGMAVLRAGKHLYSEKPLAQTAAEGQALLDLAQKKGLRIGCAPDTFFGSAHQEARAAVDAGAIGSPVGASLFMGGSGVEAWHPTPEPFYAPGAGPVPDHAPYYITQLVHLLGPIAAVSGMGSRPSPVRTLRNPARTGQTITTEVDTTSVAILEMVSGQLVTVAMSWDMGPHARVPLEVFGSLGTLHNPDPNWSDGQVRIITANGSSELDHAARPFSRKTMITFQGNAVAYWRLCGLADMADAITVGRPHRASGELALHVLEVIEAIRLSSEDGQRIAIASRCDRPAPISDDIAHANDVRPFGEELLDSRTLF
ncbi:MAG: Gfo/Idh/MocA family oxidoreductase [Novosphingobium sp.]